MVKAVLTGLASLMEDGVAATVGQSDGRTERRGDPVKGRSAWPGEQIIINCPLTWNLAFIIM